MRNMVNVFYAVILLAVCANLFYSCKGNDGLCYANLEFEITQNDECEAGQYIGFELKFVSKQGYETTKSYVIPASVQSHVIALPPSQDYDVFMRNDGVQNGCGGPIYFDIVVLDPDNDEECYRTSVDVDERPGEFVEIASFSLDATCDECPSFEGVQ